MAVMAGGDKDDYNRIKTDGMRGLHVEQVGGSESFQSCNRKRRLQYLTESQR